MAEHEERFFLCACFGEGLHITYWDDDKSFYMAMMAFRQNGKCSWRQRFRHIWRILTVGEVWLDEIVLTYADAMALQEWIATKSARGAQGPQPEKE